MLYWTDSRNKKIEVNDLHRGHRRSLIATGEDTLPRTIIVDPTTRLKKFKTLCLRVVVILKFVDS